jgi:cation:H+ antiporter
VYITYLVLSALFDRDSDGVIDKFQKDFVPPKKEITEVKKFTVTEILFCICFIILGIMGVIIGSQITVAGSIGIAEIIGIPDRVIGVTIVAMGTSLPELVTGIIAVRHKKLDIAVGNIVGSNIFNILLILGVAALISPVTLVWNTVGFLIDGVIAVVAALLLFGFAVTRKRLTKTTGIIFICIYVAYAIMTVLS